MKLIEIDNMNHKEKIQVMEALWDSLLKDANNIESPPWHEEILKERKEKIKQKTAEFISLSDLKKKYS